MRYYLSTDKRKTAFSDSPHVIATLLSCLICWLAGYYLSLGFPLTAEAPIIPMWKHLCDLLTNQLIVYVSGCLTIILIAFVLHHINDKEMLISERTRLVFMFFVLLISANAGLLPFSEVMVVLLCFVFMLNQLLSTYQLPEATGKMFNVGVLIGVSGLFIPQTLWFVPLAWIGMYQFQSLSYRSFMASLIGVLVIYWFVLAWCVWTNDFFMFTTLFAELTDFQFFTLFASLRYDHIGFIMLLILFFIAFFNIKMDAINNRVRVRQMLSFLLFMSIWSLGLISIYGGNTDAFIALLYLPLSVILAYLFENMRHRLRFMIYYFVVALSLISFFLRVWNY